MLLAFGDPQFDPPPKPDGSLQFPGALKHAPGTKPIYPEWWGQQPVLSDTIEGKDLGSCIACHTEKEQMDPVHSFACTKCHKGDATTDSKEKAHNGLVSDPGDLRYAAQTCGQCHAQEVNNVSNSAMALTPRMINHTRFAFGSQSTSEPKFSVAANDNFELIPTFRESGSLGDDLLRRSCLRCHLRTSGSTRYGEHRGKGCSACHVPYPNNFDGKHQHRIIKNLGINPCLKCHNSNHVGADFVGLYEKDYDRGFRSPFVHGKQPGHIYGMEQHPLQPDIHFQKGMTCMDCHLLEEIHGTGSSAFTSKNNVHITCDQCHVTGDHPGVFQTGDEFILLRGNRKIPKFSNKIIPHSVKNHKENVKCSACHAAWSFQDYGFHLMLEERADFWKWSTTASQNDPQIQAILKANIGTEAELIQPHSGFKPALPEEKWRLPAMYDWLSGEVSSGAWFRGFSQRTWSRPPLGKDAQNKVSIMRPMFQYVISHIDAEANVKLDSFIPITGSQFPALLFNPYSPHTIQKTGRACHECHQNPKAAGMGESMMSMDGRKIIPLWQPETKLSNTQFVWDAMIDQEGNPKQFSSHSGAGPLSKSTISLLMQPTDKFKVFWHYYLKDKTIP